MYSIRFIINARGALSVDSVKMGIRIKERRNALRLSQEKLGEKTGVTTSYIGQIERAERVPSLETLINISVALKITVDFLLQDTIKIADDMYAKKISKLLINKTDKTKETALDVIRALLTHMD